MVEIHDSDIGPLLNSFSEGVCYLNAQGALLYANETARKHWNIDGLLSNTLIYQRPVARGLAGEHILHELVHLDEQHVLLINTIPIYAGTSTVNGIVVISEDVSEHASVEKQAQIALQVFLASALDTFEIIDLDEALRRVAALIPQLESADASIALRVDSATRRLIPVAHFGGDQQSFEAWNAEISSLQQHVDDTLDSSSPAFMYSLRMGRPFMYNFTSSSIFGNPRNLSTAIYAPVFVDGEVVGLLGAERHHTRPNTDIEFPPWGVDLLAALARMVSMSMEKHALLSALENTRGEVAATQKLLNQKEEFLLLMAHDLKNPLTAIRGLAQVLRRRISRASHARTDTGQGTHDLISGLESIEQQTRKIEHMINALVEVSRIDLDRLELELQEVDLVQLARRILKEYRALAPKHELLLNVNGTPVSLDENGAIPLPAIFVQADWLRLEYILVNLVSNAVKYSPGGGPVRASIQVLPDQHVEFSIEDEGVGIPLNEQALITERFYRGEYARQNGIQGFGLGLYLVHILVSKHRGTFTVKSEGVPGKGSGVTVTLPPQ